MGKKEKAPKRRPKKQKRNNIVSFGYMPTGDEICTLPKNTIVFVRDTKNTYSPTI